MARRRPEGIVARHSLGCPARWSSGPDKGPCRCTPRYQAQVWSPHDRKRISRTFPNLAAAKAWRHDASVALRRRALVAGRGAQLREAAADWLEAAEAGLVRNRSGDPYKPSALRGYEQGLRKRILPALGDKRLSEIRRSDLQRLVNRLMADGDSASSIRNALMPLRAIYRHALALDEVAVNPTTGVQLPAVRGRRERIASPSEAADLIAALAKGDRALWATALYAGLRSGELQALADDLVDLDRNLIHVRWSWDPKAGRVAPKSEAGRRTVPIARTLRLHLMEHRLSRGRRDGLLFARKNGKPFSNQAVSQRAVRAWKAAGLEPIGLHDCRHTFASLMIAAGVNAKALSAFMGHASITITLDRYGHLFPGSEDEAAGLLEAYLERATRGVGT
jgi:integrase